MNNYVNTFENNEEITPECNNQFINVKAVKKCPLIPNRIASIRISDNENSINNYSFYQCPRSLSKKKRLNSYRKLRNNYSFDNPERVIYNNNNMNIIPKMKYSCTNNNNNISIVNSKNSFNRQLGTKPTILRYQSKEKKLKRKTSKTLIPNPNMPIVNDRNNSRFDYMESYKDTLENNENENYENIPNENYNYKRFSKYNNGIFNNNKIYHNSYHSINNGGEENDRRIIYLCDSKYN